MKHHAIVVLGDGDTWDIVDGCSICIISDAEMIGLLDGDIKPFDLEPVVELSLKDITLKKEN